MAAVWNHIHVNKNGNNDNNNNNKHNLTQDITLQKLGYNKEFDKNDFFSRTTNSIRLIFAGNKYMTSLYKMAEMF